MPDGNKTSLKGVSLAVSPETNPAVVTALCDAGAEIQQFSDVTPGIIDVGPGYLGLMPELSDDLIFTRV